MEPFFIKSKLFSEPNPNIPYLDIKEISRNLAKKEENIVYIQYIREVFISIRFITLAHLQEVLENQIISLLRDSGAGTP